MRSSILRFLAVFLAGFARGFEEEAGEGFEDVGFVDDGDFLAAVLFGVVEGESRDALAAGAGVDAGGDGDRLRVVADSEVVFPGEVEAFDVLAHEDEVDVFESSAGDDGFHRADVGEEAELFAQAHVDGAKAPADRRRQGAFEGEAGAAHGRQHFGRQGVAVFLDGGHAAVVALPGEGVAGGFQDLDNRGDDLGADAVSGDEGGGNFFARGGHISRSFRAAV